MSGRRAQDPFYHPPLQGSRCRLRLDRSTDVRSIDIHEYANARRQICHGQGDMLQSLPGRAPFLASLSPIELSLHRRPAFGRSIGLVSKYGHNDQSTRFIPIEEQASLVGSCRGLRDISLRGCSIGTRFHLYLARAESHTIMVCRDPYVNFPRLLVRLAWMWKSSKM